MAGDGVTAGTGAAGTDEVGTDTDIAADMAIAAAMVIVAGMEIEVDTEAPMVATRSAADIEGELLPAHSAAAVTDIPVDA